MTGAERSDEVVLRRVRLPLRHPMRSAHGTEVDREVVIVEVRDPDGPSGWGECSALALPTYTAEYTAGAWAVLRDVLVPAHLAGEDAGVVGHPMAQAALAGALVDRVGRRAGRSLTERVATRLGAPRPSVPRTVVLGRMPTDDLLAAVAAAVAGGAVAVKVKVTPRREDLDAVAAARAAFPDLPLAADANGSLDPRSFGVLDRLGLLYLEQPAPASDLVVSAQYARRGDTPIALDESVSTVGDLETAAALGAGAILNVKPARLGGTDAAVEVILRADDLGWPVFVGGMLETGIGRAASLAVAASARCVLPTDLGPSDAYVDQDLTEPLVLDGDGWLQVPIGPGLGRTPDRSVLAAATVDEVVLP
jgi:O-succinylbenzoate synthase